MFLSHVRNVRAVQGFAPRRARTYESTNSLSLSLRCARAARSRQSPIGASRLPVRVLYSSSSLTERRWRITRSRACRRSRPRLKLGGSREAELRPPLRIDAWLRHGSGTMYSRRSNQVGLDIVPRGGFYGESRTSRPKFFELPISGTGPSPVVLDLEHLSRRRDA